LRKFVALIVAVMLMFNAAFITPSFAATDYSIIRVNLSSMGKPTQVSVVVDGNYSIPEKNDLVLEKKSYTISIKDGQLCLSDGSKNTLLGSKFTFKRHSGADPNQLKIKNTSYGWVNYLGDMEVRKNGSSIELINHIYLETYLYGVVPYEMSNSWPLEALKAQAIAARTYAVSGKKSSGTFDLYDTEVSQVYKGYNPNYGNAIKAVNETKARVLKYGSSFVGTYYSSSNGGKTEASKNAWGGNLPYSVVKDDPYDVRNPSNSNATWAVTYKKQPVDTGLVQRLLARLKDKLEARGYSGAAQDIKITAIKGITLVPFPDSGRVKSGEIKLEIEAKVKNPAQGKPATEIIEETVAITKDNARGIFNIKSTLVTVEETETEFILRGGGFGHGVGMSQYGAQQMAREGFNYAQILEFYYPGTTLQTLSIKEPNPTPMPSRGGDRPSDPEPPKNDPPKQDPPKQDKPPAQEDNKLYGIVNVSVSSSLNVRSGPGTTYKKVGSLFRNDKVEVLEKGSTWHKIKKGNLVGYVHSNYLKIEGGTTPPSNNKEEKPVDNTPPAIPPNQDKRYGIVTASALNVRSGAGTKYKRIGYVYKNNKVEILSSSGGWHKISYNGLVGYVSGQYIKLETSSSSPNTSEPVTKYGIVTASVLNVRSGASTKNSIIGQLKKNQTVNIISSSNGWHKIQFGSKTGYVHGDYVKISSTQTGNSNTNKSSKTGTVTASALNLRTGAGTSHKIIGVLKRNATITILETKNGWHKIQYGSTTGYVSGSYVKVN